MKCQHQNPQTTCDGTQHTTWCGDCDVTLTFDVCPEAGTWPSEPETEA